MPDPIYEVVEEQGPDHAKTFVVQLIVQGEVTAKAAGRTKKEAQQQAAREALRTLAVAEHCSVRLDARSHADDDDAR
jgi:ribonuclease-3